MVTENPVGHLDPVVRTQMKELLQKYVAAAAPHDVDPADVVFAIGSEVYGIDVNVIVPTNKEASTTTTTTTAAKVSDNNGNNKECIVDFDYMQQFIKDVFLSYGVTEERAETCSDVLIESDKRGIDSHGLGRLKPIYCDRMDRGILFPDKPITMVRETEATALVDGNLGLGLYVAPYCMQLAIDKAKKCGVGVVVAQRSTHYGIAGYYATMATDQGCVGFATTNARPSIAPTYGVEPVLGTNPLCFGIPTDDEFPFCIDCATSIRQRGKIEQWVREGVPTPRGCVIDESGIERTDSAGILRDMVLGKCCLTPMGGAGDKMAGYKGYGWATTVELLCTAFQSGPFGEGICGIDRKTGKPMPMPLGHLFLAIDVEAICSLDTFKKNASSLLQTLRDAKKAPNGPGRIWTAGEPERK